MSQYGGQREKLADPFATDPAVPVLRPGSRAVLVFAAVAGLCVANLYYIIPLLPEIGAALHRPAADFASLLSVTQVGYAAGLLFIVPLGDMVDRRRLSTVLLAASGLVLLAIPFTTGAAFFALFTVLGLVSVTAMVLVPWAADFADDKERGRVVGSVMTGLILGSLLCRSFAGALAQVASWQTVYWVAAAFMALSMVAVRWAMPSGAARRPGPRPADGTGYLRLIGSLPGVMLHTPKVIERCLYGGLGFGAFSVFWTVLPLRLTAAPFHYGAAEIGLFGFLGAAGVLGASLAGRLADRSLQTFATLAAFALVGGTFLVLGAGAGGLAVLIAGTVLLDLAVQAAHITNQSVVYAGNPLIRSRITTAYMVSYFGGGALGSALAASVWRSSGWAATCLLGAGFAAAALLVFGVYALARRMAPRSAG